MLTGNRSSGVIQLSGFGDLGGNKFTHRHLSNYFNYDQPYNFGKRVARIQASFSPLFYPKTLTAMTMVKGNTYDIDTDVYNQSAAQDVDRLFRFMENGHTVNSLSASDPLGDNNEEFFIVLDVDQARTNSILQLSDNRYLLKVTSDPIPYGNWFKYSVKIQGSDPKRYVPSSLLLKGKTCIEAASQAKNYGNQTLPGVSMGTQIKFQNVIGRYGRQFSIDEKVMRKEIQARQYGKETGASTNLSRFVDKADQATGLAFSLQGKNKKTGEISEIPSTGFISQAEAKTEELTMLDREVMMKFGHFEEAPDTVTGMVNTRMAPGFRDLVRDGHEMYHNGSITASQMESYLMGIFLARVAENDRAIETVTGELGALVFDQLIAQMSRGFLTVDTHFIRQADGGANQELEYGAQFRAFRARNGVKINLRFDRMNDDPYYCQRRYPLDSNYTIDSLRFDFYDFGMTNNSPRNSNGSNVCMITEGASDQIYWKIGRMNPYTGYLNSDKNGVYVTSEDTDATYKRIISGSLNIQDTSRIGAIVYDPDYGA